MPQSLINVQTVLNLIDRMIHDSEDAAEADLLKSLRQKLIDELDELPWDWR